MSTARSGVNGRSGSEPARSDNRNTRRARLRLMVRFGTTVPDKTGFTKNVSESGLFIHTNQVFRPGTTIQVEAQFPDRKFTFWGRVVWAKQVPPQLAHILECGMGVCFVNPSPAWLDYYLAWRKRSGQD